MKEIFHVMFHETGKHEYFKNLASIFAHHTNEEIGCGSDWLYRHDFSERFVNGRVYIFKGELKETKSAAKKILKAVNNS